MRDGEQIWNAWNRIDKLEEEFSKLGMLHTPLNGMVVSYLLRLDSDRYSNFTTHSQENHALISVIGIAPHSSPRPKSQIHPTF